MVDTINEMKDDEFVAMYIDCQHSVSEMLRRFGFKTRDPRAWKYLANIRTKLGLESKRSIEKRIVTDENVEYVKQVASKCHTKTELLEALGLYPVGGNFEHLGAYMNKHNIVLTPKPRDSKLHLSFDDVYCEETKICRSGLHSRVLKDMESGLLDMKYICSVCGNAGVWNGAPLPLHIDHINGNSKDNRLENLRWICPNCHAQTETYSGKNRQHINKKLPKAKHLL